MSDPKSYRVISLPEPVYSYLNEVMERFVREGLLVPDELPFASALWDRIKNAQVVQVPLPTEESAPLNLEGGSDADHHP